MNDYHYYSCRCRYVWMHYCELYLKLHMYILNPIGLLEDNKLSLERYAGNTDLEDSDLSEDEARYWTALNLANFFLENFTEAIICVILLCSGYDDFFLKLFAIPTIINASVRFLKILIPFLVYTALPFCLDIFLMLWEYVSACVAFIFR